MKVKTAQGAQRSRRTRASKATAQPPCQREFQRAQAECKNYLLPAGLYKLREAYRSLDQIEDTLQVVAKLIQKRSGLTAGSMLGSHCTTDDKAYWLKGLPKAFAWELGYQILPAAAALTGDGLSKSQVTTLVAHSKDRAQAILADCEQAHRILSISVEAEYSAMRDGESIVAPLILKMRSLLNFLLEEAFASMVEPPRF